MRLHQCAPDKPGNVSKSFYKKLQSLVQLVVVQAVFAKALPKRASSAAVVCRHINRQTLAATTNQTDPINQIMRRELLITIININKENKFSRLRRDPECTHS